MKSFTRTNGQRRAMRRSTIAFQSIAEQGFKHIVSILSKHPKKRTPFEVEHLTESMGGIKFFSDLIDQHGEETHEECCRRMIYRHMVKDECVFEQGSVGTEFFVILFGKVGVYVWMDHTYQQFEERQKNPELRKIDQSYPPKELKCLVEVKSIETGASFGELALMGGKNKHRAATIICKEESHFGILDRDSFKKILNDKEEAKMQRHVTFLNNIAIFRELHPKIVRQIFLYMEIKVYEMNHVVYDEGDQAESFYIVRSGDFLVSKNIKLNKEKRRAKPSQWELYGKEPEYDNVERKIALLGREEFFGDIELYEKTTRKYKVTCRSTSSEVYVLAAKEFFRRVLVEQSVKKFVPARVSHLKKFYNKRLDAIINTYESPDCKAFILQAKIQKHRELIGGPEALSDPIDKLPISPFFNKERSFLPDKSVSLQANQSEHISGSDSNKKKSRLSLTLQSLNKLITPMPMIPVIGRNNNNTSVPESSFFDSTKNLLSIKNLANGEGSFLNNSGNTNEPAKNATQNLTYPEKRFVHNSLPAIQNPLFRKYSLNSVLNGYNLDTSIISTRNSNGNILTGDEINDVSAFRNSHSDGNCLDPNESRQNVIQNINQKLKASPQLSDFSQILTNKLEFFKEYKEIKDSKLHEGERGKSRMSILMRLFEMNNRINMRKPKAFQEKLQDSTPRSIKGLVEKPSENHKVDSLLKPLTEKKRKRMSFLHNERLEYENLKAQLLKVKI